MGKADGGGAVDGQTEAASATPANETERGTVTATVADTDPSPAQRSWGMEDHVHDDSCWWGVDDARWSCAGAW